MTLRTDEGRGEVVYQAGVPAVCGRVVPMVLVEPCMSHAVALRILAYVI